MCNHEFIKINEYTRVCVRCGLTFCGGRILFDRKIANEARMNRERKCKNGKKRN